MTAAIFKMRTDAAWLSTLDTWRRTQPDLPSRAEAVRRLVALGLKVPGYIAAIEMRETKP